MAIIIPANSAADTGYSIDNSCRFNLADSAYVHKTQGTSTDTDKYTLSVWLTRGSNLGAVNSWFSEGTGLTAQADYNFSANGTMMLYNRDASSNIFQLVTNRVFRDVAAWYHVVLLFDSSQATDTNRMKLYINGTQETSFSTATYPAQDFNSEVNKGGTKHTWAAFDSNGSIVNEFDGYVAEALFLDGTVAAIGDLGEFDSDSPSIWKPKDVSGLTFGTNGYYLDFEDSANLGNDANGGTDFTETNLAAADQSIDSPTNNFCVMNPLTKGSYITLSEGNLLVTGNSATDQASIYGTLSANAGKWYAEAKITVGGTDSYPLVCISHINDQQYGSATNGGNDDPGRYNTASGCYRANGDKRSNNVTSSSWGNSFDDDDIISIAIDCDNGATYVAKNGTWENSGDPTSGGTKTGALVTWTPANEDMSTFSDSQYNSSSSNWNFGSPAFTISSGNADANGYGNFEYAPPAGYLSLCTKNLGSDGG